MGTIRDDSFDDDENNNLEPEDTQQQVGAPSEDILSNFVLLSEVEEEDSGESSVRPKGSAEQGAESVRPASDLDKSQPSDARQKSAASVLSGLLLIRPLSGLVPTPYQGAQFLGSTSSL
jgi:hypothetical protein